MRRPPTNPRKTPTQTRSRVTVEAILEAAAHILEKEGDKALTTNRVAERAGVSIGSLYQYYPNKQSLLVALHARHLDKIKASANAAIDEVGGSLAEAVVRLVQTIVASHVGSDGLHRLVAEETPESLAKTSTQELIRHLLETYRSILNVENLDLAAYMIGVTVKAVVHGALVDRPNDLREGRITSELSRLLLSYLNSESQLNAHRSLDQ
jgi:AcrR family transcriptional regulator